MLQIDAYDVRTMDIRQLVFGLLLLISMRVEILRAFWSLLRVGELPVEK